MNATEIRRVWAREDQRRYDQTAVQTLILSKERFPSLRLARAWIKKNKFELSFRGKEGDETETSYRFRQRDIGFFRPGTLRTIDLSEGVQSIIGRPK